MSHLSLPRRAHATVAGAVGIAAALVLAACGGGDSAASGGATDAAPAAADGAYPVTIDGALGSTTIESEPQRVVALGWGAADIAVSLGVVPVGIERDDYAGDEEGFSPWLREALEADGTELPETITMYPELDVDAVVALEPDLVLAPQSGLEQDVFDQLSQFVPVVAYPEKAWQTPWREQIEIAGTALGRSEEAAGLIAGMEQQFADAAAANPQLADVDFAYVYAGEPGALHAYVAGDSRVDFLVELGMQLAPGVQSLSADDGTFTAQLGLENANVLDDADVVFTWFNDDAEQQMIEQQPLYAQIPAVQGGAYVPLVDPALGMATSVTTPLSVPWAIDAFVPVILDAVAAV